MNAAATPLTFAAANGLPRPRAATEDIPCSK